MILIVFAFAFAQTDPRRPTVAEHFAASASVSCLVTACVHPIDTVKTRLAVSIDHKPSIRSTVADIMRESGWRGFGRGLLPSLASAVPFSGASSSCTVFVSCTDKIA